MKALRRLWFLLTRRRQLADLEEEMRLHVELREQANRRRGLGPGTAEQAARQRFGNRLRLREESGDVWGFHWFDLGMRTLRFAWRQLRARPMWTATVVLTLGLGIGATTAVFTLVDTVLLKPAPAVRPDRLAWVASMDARSGRVRKASLPEYLDYRDRARSFSGLLAYAPVDLSLGGGGAVLTPGVVVSGNYFDVLGLRPRTGRLLGPGDEIGPGDHAFVVLGDRLWQRRFDGDPAIVGRTLPINGHPFTVVGVAPAGFDGLELGSPDLWVPLGALPLVLPSHPGWRSDRGASWLRIAGRLRDDVSMPQADSEMRVVAANVTEAAGRTERPTTARVSGIRGGLEPGNRSQLVLMFSLLSLVPVLVLVVACANVANVLISRNLDRRREFALRRAIGASRAQLVGELLIESGVLAAAAGAVGFALARLLIITVEHLGEFPPDVSAVLVLDQRALVATGCVAVATILLFGLLPALGATRFALLPVLKDDSPNMTASRRRSRLRGALVVAQVTVSLTLLVAAGLFVRSVSTTMRLDPGFDADGAVRIAVDPQLQGYTPERTAAFFDALTRRVRSMPGVTATAVARGLPLSDGVGDDVVQGDGAGDSVESLIFRVSPDYFDTMGIPIRAGRTFTTADVEAGAPVALVNATLWHRLWGDEPPLGRRLRMADDRSPAIEVVGVVEDGKYGGLTERQQPGVYLALARSRVSPVSFIARTSGDEGALLRGLTEAVASLDPDLPVAHAEPLSALVAARASGQRATASMLFVFGAIALVLSAAGIYAVAAHGVALRTREIGIRLALGARRFDVLRLFLREQLRRILVGLGLGLAASLLASRLLAAFLSGLSPTDAWSFAIAAATLSAVALVATWLPARQAARTDPQVALRHE